VILLASTSDLLRVVTSSTSAVDVHASWVDLNGTTVTPGRTNTLISSATTTTVVGSPASSTYRTVKALTVRNRGVATNVVTILHSDGTSIPELIEATLGPDTSLQYHEAAGWWVTDAQGRAAAVNYTNVGTPITDADSITVLGSDVTNNNASANTIADVTGLSFSVTSGEMYYFDFNIIYTAAATATGSRWSINGPATTYLQYRSEYSLTTTTTTRNAVLTAYDLPAASNATSAATGQNWASIYGVIKPSADGTVIARFASEVSSSAIVAKADSWVRFRQITP
jgi:hypothetical protein